MNQGRIYWAMLRYHLHQPMRIWLLLVVLTAQSAFMGWIFNTLGQQETSGVGQSMGYMGVMFGVIMMASFVGGSVGTSSASWAWILPHAEFLLTRPVPRGPIYLPLLLLCFGILLVCPVLNVIWTAPHPDMLLSLYHSGAQSTEAAQDLAIYRHAFPSSSVIQLPHEKHSTLLIPRGSTLEALWFLWQSILLAMILEAVTLISLPTMIQRRVYGALACIPAALILCWHWIVPHLAIEETFFFFAEHLVLVIATTIACFTLLQWFAWKRIRQIEVN